MAIVKRTAEKIRSGKGRIDKAKADAMTEADKAAWKRAHGVDDAFLGRARFVRPKVNVRKLRERLGLSQHEFASPYMLSLRTIQEWEQNRREPSEPARVLLLAINRDL